MTTWFSINQDVAINIHTPRSFTAYWKYRGWNALIGAGGDMIHTGGLVTYRGTISTTAMPTSHCLC